MGRKDTPCQLGNQGFLKYKSGLGAIHTNCHTMHYINIYYVSNTILGPEEILFLNVLIEFIF